MSNSEVPQPILDHIVILVSHATLEELPERLKDTFIVSPGGTHAGGLTVNKLILFEDGVYIELIAFVDGVDAEARKKHRWGSQRENTIIDWAYTLPHESDFSTVQQRVRAANTELTYNDPVPGGRVKPDGTVLKWSIGAAKDAAGHGTAPGTLPFWCLDRTPRHLRVPYEDSKEQTQHPSGARGVSRIRLAVDKEELPTLVRVYNAIHNKDAEEQNSDSWLFAVPSTSSTARHTVAVAADGGAKIKLALQGSVGSPSFLELLPDVVVKFEA